MRAGILGATSGESNLGAYRAFLPVCVRIPDKRQILQPVSALEAGLQTHPPGNKRRDRPEAI